MGALTGSTISSSYDMLLKTATTGGVTSTLKVIEDGLGIDSALKLSTTVVSVNGSLGVGLSGTDTPSYKLEVYESAGATSAYIQIGSVSYGEMLIGVDETGSRHQAPTGGDIQFITDAGTSMTIASYGFVGIGTAAPIGLLSLESEGDNCLQ